MYIFLFFFFQAEDGIRDHCVTGVQTCALPICQGLGVEARAVADLAGHLHVGQEAHLDGRSEEHTSELQSHSDLVCRLLLEKKKKKTQQYDANTKKIIVKSSCNYGIRHVYRWMA